MASKSPNSAGRSRTNRILWSLGGFLLGGAIGSFAGFRQSQAQGILFGSLGALALAFDGARSGACILESLFAFLWTSG